jgi:hypothetical protein
MRPENPRKSSTSSGNRFDRPRYLLIEVAGVPPLSPRALETILGGRLSAAGTLLKFRVIRTEGAHGLVAVSHLDVPAARNAWNGPRDRPSGSVRTLRSYGTLRKGKAWILRQRTPRVVPPVRASARGPVIG